MSWVAIGVGGASLVSGMMGSNAAKSGARQQTAAAKEAVALQRQMYEQGRNDLADYRLLGQTGIKDLVGSMPELTATFGAGDMQKDPGYDFRMQEGQKALERTAAARGNLTGGGTMKALARYGQDYASNEYQNAYNRFNIDRDQRYGKLMDLVGTGQNAATQSGAIGQNYASQAGQNIVGAGNAQSAAGIASANAWGNALQQGIGTYGMMGGANSGGSPKVTPTSSSDGYVSNINNVSRAYGPSNYSFDHMIKSSDSRLKTKIERLEKSIFKEVPTYRFEYKDESFGVGPQIGVMAQDLLELNPNHPAVISSSNGYLVDYSKLEKVAAAKNDVRLGDL